MSPWRHPKIYLINLNFMKNTSNSDMSSKNSDDKTADFIEVDSEDLALSPDMIQESEALPHHQADYIYNTEGAGS